MIATRILPKKILLKQKWKKNLKTQKIIHLRANKIKSFTLLTLYHIFAPYIYHGHDHHHMLVYLSYIYAPENTTHSIQTRFLQNSSYHLICLFVHGICCLLCSTSMRIVLILFSTTKMTITENMLEMWCERVSGDNVMQFISSKCKEWNHVKEDQFISLF